LHGIPVLLKDNIGTADKLNTTAGSFALLGSVVSRDSGVVQRLREAGAVILGKASLSEWAYFRSDQAPSGWCARTGQGRVSLHRPSQFHCYLLIKHNVTYLFNRNLHWTFSNCYTHVFITY
jgi:Amidase